MTPAYPLSLLGFEPAWRGRALSGRPLDILAALADSEEARMGDGAIIEALWPEDAPARPLRALHVVVSRVRALVGDGVVERVGDGYRLVLAAADVDARDLAARAARARACAAAGQWARVLELTDDLPRPPESGAATAPAQSPPRRPATRAGSRRADGALPPSPLARLREHAAADAAAAGRARALALETTGDHERAAPLLRAAVEDDPGDETVLAALIRAGAWARSPAAAMEI